MKEIFKKNKCRLCESKNLKPALNLGYSPLANSFSKYRKKNKKYPLKVLRCINCNHLQLSHVINEKKLFSEYLFVSGTSKTNLRHFKNYANECKKRFLSKKSKILDIASNDGSFLKFFSYKNLKVGIDPAKNIVSNLKNPNFHTEKAFFNYNSSIKLKKKYGNFDLITANNVCAHVNDLRDFVLGIKNLLSKNGVFIFEVGYFHDVLLNKTFDTIYHEHLDYHLFTPLISFFKKYELEIFDVKNIFIQGGSIRVYVGHIRNHEINTKNLRNLIYKEKKMGYSNKTLFDKFQKFIKKKREHLLTQLQSILEKNKKIAGYGASAKSTTFLNYFKLDSKHLNFIADLNIFKQNRYSPGSNIKILHPKNIYQKKIDYILILSWNFSIEIIKQNINFLKKGGKFIIPFPRILILDKSNYKKYLK